MRFRRKKGNIVVVDHLRAHAGKELIIVPGEELRFTTDDGKVFDVRLLSNAIRVRSVDRLIVEPEVSNSVVIRSTVRS